MIFKNKKQYLTVLVAHNGFVFDFPILLAEVERRPGVLATSVFEERNIHISDDLPLLRKVAQLNTIVCIVLSNNEENGGQGTQRNLP